MLLKFPFLEISSCYFGSIQWFVNTSAITVRSGFPYINMPWYLREIEFGRRCLPQRNLESWFTTRLSWFCGEKGFELDATGLFIKAFSSLSRFLKACPKAQEWNDLQPAEENGSLSSKPLKEQKSEWDFRWFTRFCESAGQLMWPFQLKVKKLISRWSFGGI